MLLRWLTPLGTVICLPFWRQKQEHRLPREHRYGYLLELRLPKKDRLPKKECRCVYSLELPLCSQRAA